MWILSKKFVEKNSKNYRCSQVLEEDCLADTYLIGDVSALLNLKSTQDKYLSKGKMKESLIYSQFGTTYKLLTEDHGTELLMSYLEDFHVKISQSQEKVLELKEENLDFGKKCLELFARFHPNTFSWKTPQCSLLEDWEEYLEIFPRQGIMLDGMLYHQDSVERLIKEKGCGYWELNKVNFPTPRCHDALKPSVSELRRNSPCISSLIWDMHGRSQLMDASWCEYYIMGFPKNWSSLEDFNHRDFFYWSTNFKRKIENINKFYWVEDNIPKVSDSIVNRKIRIKCIGNAQVPICAALSFILLLKFYYE